MASDQRCHQHSPSEGLRSHFSHFDFLDFGKVTDFKGVSTTRKYLNDAFNVQQSIISLKSVTSVTFSTLKSFFKMKIKTLSEYFMERSKK